MLDIDLHVGKSLGTRRSDIILFHQIQHSRPDDGTSGTGQRVSLLLGGRNPVEKEIPAGGGKQKLPAGKDRNLVFRQGTILKKGGEILCCNTH